MRYLVGADGGRSLISQTLGITFPGKTLGVRVGDDLQLQTPHGLRRTTVLGLRDRNEPLLLSRPLF